MRMPSFPTTATLLLAAALGGCATRLPEPVSGYTCCNLHASGGWVSSGNVLGGSFVPAGQPAKADTIKRQYYVYGEVGGESYAFRNDSARSEQDTLVWLRRIIVAEDPRARMAHWSPAVRNAVGAGRVMPGMSRDQVIVALGYPSAEDTRDLDSPTWRYWTSIDDTPVDLDFATDGTLVKVNASPAALALVVFQP